MLFEQQVISSLIFFAAAYPIISYQFQNGKTRSTSKLAIIAVALAVACQVKLSYDTQALQSNHYKSLEVGRHSSVLEIRKSYKKLSKKYHPDKNPGEDALAKFEDLKASYDILMDESSRDIYNRFGPSNLDFDPRKDEMKLISDIAVVYVYYIVVGYIMTLPVGARASRTWIAILGIILLVAEVCFALTESSLPDWMPDTLTEFELLFYLHSAFPVVIAGLRCLAEHLYVDPDHTSIAVLKEIFIQQKTLSELLLEVQSLVEISVSNDNKLTTDKTKIEQLQEKIVELRDQIDNSNENAVKSIERLRNCSSNPGANYYWIIFVLMYGGILYYFFFFKTIKNNFNFNFFALLSLYFYNSFSFHRSEVIFY